MSIFRIFTFTFIPEHLQETVAHMRSRLLKMLRRQRCVCVRNRCMIFCYPNLEKQEEFGCRFDFFLPPEMCPNGCAGDGCLRNQQKLSCLAGHPYEC